MRTQYTLPSKYFCPIIVIGGWIVWFTVGCSTITKYGSSPSKGNQAVDRFYANIQTLTLNGDTALHRAAIQGRIEVVTRLLEDPHIDVNVRNGYGDTALHIAAEADHIGVVTSLLSNPNIDVNVKDRDGNTALHIAAIYGHIEVVTRMRRQLGH